MYENAIDVLKAVEVGDLSAIDAEGMLKDLKFETPKIKKKPSSGIKEFLSKSFANNDSLNFINSLDYLATVILFLKDRGIVLHRDSKDLHILLESAELAEIVSAIGFLKKFLPTARTTKGSHQKYVKALMGELSELDISNKEDEDKDDFFEEEGDKSKDLIYQ